MAAEKIAVDQASRRRLARSSTLASIGMRSAGAASRRYRLLRSCAPAECGPFFDMPNIKQQKKRVRIAARQRVENLRYRSTVKTLTKRLEAAVADGDKDTLAAEHRELVRTIDKARRARRAAPEHRRAQEVAGRAPRRRPAPRRAALRWLAALRSGRRAPAGARDPGASCCRP